MVRQVAQAVLDQIEDYRDRRAARRLSRTPRSQRLTVDQMFDDLGLEPPPSSNR
jgi:hypothetical protein